MKKVFALLLAILLLMTACVTIIPEATVTEPNLTVPAQLWFDNYAGVEGPSGEQYMSIQVDAFPGITFRATTEKVFAIADGIPTELYSGMPVSSVYFADLTGDGLPELCSTFSLDSGIVSKGVIVYDYAAGVSYFLHRRGRSDYILSADEGQLCVERFAWGASTALEIGRLVCTDGALQLIPLPKPEPPTTAPTETTAPPTEATAESTTEPTEPTTPGPYRIFRFDGEQPVRDLEIDISGLQEGWLYSYDEQEEKIYLIADWDFAVVYEKWSYLFVELDVLTTSYEYIYFTSADHKTVYCSSYTGENRTVVYETEHEITCINYAYDEYYEEILVITEEDKRAILLEISTGTATVLVERDLVRFARYDPNLDGEKGPYIEWYGEDYIQGSSEFSHIFFLYLRTGEIEDDFRL